MTLEGKTSSGRCRVGGERTAASRPASRRMCSILGLPDRFIEQGTQAEQLQMAGLSPTQIEQRIGAALAALDGSQAARA